MSLFLVYLPSGKKYVDCNIERMIDKKEFNLRQNKTLLEVKIYSNTILELKEKIEGFLSLLDGIDEQLKLVISLYPREAEMFPWDFCLICYF